MYIGLNMKIKEKTLYIIYPTSLNYNISKTNIEIDNYHAFD